MPKAKTKSINTTGTNRKPIPLTKNVLLKAINTKAKERVNEAMELMGYVLTTEGDWLVKVAKDGSKTKVEKLVKSNKAIRLD